MGRKKLDVLGIVAWIVGIIVSIGIGGLFLNGTMHNVAILSLIPLIIHQAIAIIIYLSAGVGLLKYLKLI